MSENGRRALVRLSAALAAGERARWIEALRTAIDEAPPTAVEESLLQSYLFLGFPAAVAALADWRHLTGTRPMSESVADASDLAEWRERGEVVCREVYGRAYEKLRGSVRLVHPAMDDWMICEGYGKVLSRDGLDLATRELCIVAILAATRWEPQLHSHLRGALHVGCSPSAVEDALEEGIATTADEVWRDRARALWRRVRDRSQHVLEQR